MFLGRDAGAAPDDVGMVGERAEIFGERLDGGKGKVIAGTHGELEDYATGIFNGLVAG